MKEYKCEICGESYSWGEMHGHFDNEILPTTDVEKLSAFLINIEDLAKERGILPAIGIPTRLFEDSDIWVCVCNFQIGRKP